MILQLGHELVSRYTGRETMQTYIIMNCDAITMATCVLVEDKDFLPTKYPINTP